LHHQLNRKRQRDETINTQRAGIVYVAWSGRNGPGDLDIPRKFKNEILRLVAKQFPRKDYRYFPLRGMEALLRESAVPWDEERYSSQ
jgi:hypothetical protein